MLTDVLRPPLWKAANRFGGTRLKRWSQNEQYRHGKWAYLADGRRPEVTELVERLARGGRVVEHACGEGHLAARVDPACYESYLAYDISDVAVAAARTRAVSDRCRFEVRDIASWKGDAGLSLVVAEECLYYLRPADLTRFLATCRASLTPDGAVLATFHDASRYGATVAECRARFPDHDEMVGPAGALFLVLRP